MTITTAQRTQLVELYVAIAGRAPDAAGLSYWANQVSNGATISQVAGYMYNTNDARAIYPLFLSNDEIVTKFYVNVLGRTPDDAGKAYWVNNLNTNGVVKTLTDMIYSVDNYTGTDAAALASKALFQNKVAVGTYFAVTLGSNDLTAAQNAFNNVTSDPASVTTVQNSLSGANGQTVVLTTGIDNLVGGAGNDTFIGDNSGTATVSAGDQIDGGAGTNTFDYYGFNGVVPQVKNIQNINVFGTASNSMDWSGDAALTKLTVDAATGGESGSQSIKVGTGAAVTLSNYSYTGGDADRGTVINSPDAAVNLTLSKVSTGVGNIDIGTASNVANTTLNLVSTGDSNQVILHNTGGSLSTIDISGDKKLTLDASAATHVTTIDASAATGKQTIVVDTTAASSSLAKGTLTVKGGSANDKIDISAHSTWSDNAVIDGGAGTNTLKVNVGGDLANVFDGTNHLANIQIAEVASAYTLAANATVNVSKLSSATGVTFDSALTVDGTTTKVLTLDKVASGFTLGLGADLADAGNGAGTVINVAGAAQSHTDVLNVALSKAGAQAVAGFTAQNVETVAFNESAVAGTASTVSHVIDDQLQTLTLASSAVDANGNAVKAAQFTAGAGWTSTVISTIDASAYNGKVDLSALSGNLIATGATITGGGDLLTVVGGSGADVITAGKGGVALTVGTGAETINLSASSAVAETITFDDAKSIATKMDVISGFGITNSATTADTLHFASAKADLGDASYTAIQTGVTNLTAQSTSGILTFGGSAAASASVDTLIAAARALVDTAADKAVAFQSGGNTYVVASGHAAQDAAHDNVIELVGVTGLTSIGAAAADHTLIIA